ADIFYGGEVSADTINCPFHLWNFDGRTGSCINIPYLKKGKPPSSTAKLKTYESLELNGLVYVWYHANEKLKSLWEPLVLEGFSNLVYQGRTEYEISCHIQDIPENGSDVNHWMPFIVSALWPGGTREG
ncbi:Neverland, partial [Caligus rogercresseyi]